MAGYYIARKNSQSAVEVILSSEPRSGFTLPNDNSGRVDFLRRFIDEWQKGQNDEFFTGIYKSESVWKRFGERVMFTLTGRPYDGDDLQFRCWYAGFGRLSSDHVDSCGRGDLFEVGGARQALAPFIDAFTERRMRWDNDRNRTTLWAGFRDEDAYGRSA